MMRRTGPKKIWLIPGCTENNHFFKKYLHNSINESAHFS
ncbi:MAG: hypothetical protein AVDCRST_MAG56-6478 [uncultured Cytophagales bacterium]|uniref:Uncharacterized protein n=1 Tax=uncultured Cytophagales bacterium TaxID=158755 RepID=A0A6J4KGT6_9SPHI|nr:MAG: hypothetical protein AVDCRST_MAG56-6478 [uncultured Cytophagales bacterium]